MYARATRGRAILTIKVAAVQGGSRAGPEILDRYQDALRIAEAGAAADPNDTRAVELVAYVLNKIGGTQQSLGDLAAAEATYKRVSAMYETAMKADPDNARARQGAMGFYKNVGDLYFYSMKKWTDALNAYRRAGELMEAETHSDPENYIVRQRYSEVLTCIGSCLLRLGQPREARQQTKRGLDMARELADRPTATHDHKYNYAWLAVTVEPDDMQEPARALPYIRKVVEMDHGNDEYSLHVLAQAYMELGDYEHAIEAEERGLKLYPPLAPGAPKTGMQQTVENTLQICRDELKKKQK
jgi:tetratricopeptide (TPR) repeat protein